MGTPFKLYEGKEANLPAELTAGGIYFCEDSGNVFIDVDIDGTITRVPLGKKYVDDQLTDIRAFIENQGSGIEIGDEPPTKESANVWIDTDDEDIEEVELEFVTSVNGQSGDVSITASDIGAVKCTYYSGDMNQLVTDGHYHLSTNANLPVYAYSGQCIVSRGNDQNTVVQLVFGVGYQGKEHYAIFRSGKLASTWQFESWAQFATSDYTLLRDGSVAMTGNLTIEKQDPVARLYDTATKGEVTVLAANNRVYLQTQNTTDDDKNRRYLEIVNSKGATSMADAAVLVDIANSSLARYKIYHEGNKPTAEDVDAAPRQFGLGNSDVGDESGMIQFTDTPAVVDTYKNTGWFGFASDSNSLISGSGISTNTVLLRVEAINDNYCTQTAYTMSGHTLTRKYKNGVWKQWEWVNPPVAPGAEFRTTEQYIGKTVYTKTIRHTLTASIGSASTVTTLTINGQVSDRDNIVDVSAVYVTPSNNTKTLLPMVDNSGNICLSISSIQPGTLQTTIVVKNTPLPANAYFDIVYRYTKMTES